MKLILTTLLFLLHGLMLNGQAQQYFQLKIYTFDTQSQENQLDKYLSEAFLPALYMQAIGNVGVFKEIPEIKKDSLGRIYVLIPYLSLYQFETLDAQLSNDEVYLEAAEEYLNASHENPPYNRIENIILKAFSDMPLLEPTRLSGDRSKRVYELRSYESATEEIFKNKMDMFNAGGEIALFEQLDFNAVFYGEVLVDGSMPNLMYMTTHKNMEIRDQNWEKFVDSQGWKTMSGLSKYQNNVSHIDIILLYSTDYSNY